MLVFSIERGLISIDRKVFNTHQYTPASWELPKVPGQKKSGLTGQYKLTPRKEMKERDRSRDIQEVIKRAVQKTRA